MASRRPRAEAQPVFTDEVTLTGTTAAALSFGNLDSVVVHAYNLGSTATAPYVETDDYVLDTTAGTIARSGGGSAATQRIVATTIAIIAALGSLGAVIAVVVHG